MQCGDNKLGSEENKIKQEEMDAMFKETIRSLSMLTKLGYPNL